VRCRITVESPDVSIDVTGASSLGACGPRQRLVPVERLLHGRRVERRAVVELDPGAELDRDRLLVRGERGKSCGELRDDLEASR